MKLTDQEAQEAMAAIKLLHRLAMKTENRGLIRAAKTMHKRARRYGEKYHTGVTIKAGST